MLKIVVGSFKVFKVLQNLPFVRKFVIFDIRSFDSLNNVEDFSFAVSSISTESKHGKATNPQRFADLDEMTFKYLSMEVKSKIHDVAVSSGVTSCELLRKAKLLKLDYEFTISDKYVNYYHSGNKVVRIYNADKKLLYGYVCGILADENVSKYYPLSKLLYFIIKHLPVLNVFNKVQLFDVDTKYMLQSGELNYVEYDLFGLNDLKNYTFVRCMNVLNSNSWFTEQQIIMGISNIKSSMIEGGILLIGRTVDITGENNASFFKKINNKLVHLEDFNLGSDIKNIIQNNFG